MANKKRIRGLSGECAYLASGVIGGDDPASSSVVTRCYGRFFLGIWKIPQGENEHKISLRTALRGRT